jgi:hypothetical protein
LFPKIKTISRSFISHLLDLLTDVDRLLLFERIDNAKAHFGDDGSLDNIVFIVRGLNTPGQMSRLKFLRIFLYSPLLAPKCSPEVTEKVSA